MRQTIILVIIAVLASCNSREAMHSDGERSLDDSLSLAVAVMPQLSALPVYYAEATGMTRSLEHPVRLLRYHSQMDVDTALLHRHANIAICDSVRFCFLQETTPLQALLESEEPLSLVTHQHARVSKFRDLKDKMVALARLSEASAWCNSLTEGAGMRTYDIFRPQINDIALRASMLESELVDAAVLPEPYATIAVQKGHNRLATTRDGLHGKSLWVAMHCSDSAAVTPTVVESFVNMYNQAVQEMNAGKHPELVRQILVEDYALDAAAVDTLRLPPMKPATSLLP